MDVGTTVYFLWYDFLHECERMMQGTVEDNSLWADHPRNSQLVNVRFRMPGIDGTVCHHFPASHLCTDSVRALQECSHDDCWMVCGKIAENVPKSSLFVPTKPDDDVLPADDRAQLEAFKRENWDHQHNHLRTDKLDEFYQLWRMAMVPFGYVEAAPTIKAVMPTKAATKPMRIVSDEQMKELKSELKKQFAGQPTAKKKKKRQSNVIELSLF